MVTDYPQRKMRITNLMSSYIEFKKICSEFISILSESLKNNNYSATVNAISDIKLEVLVLQSCVEVYFDYVLINDDVRGVIKCDEILDIEKQRRNLAIYYIDWDGRVYLSPTGGKVLSVLNNRYFPEMILIQICEVLFSQHVVRVSESDNE